MSLAHLHIVLNHVPMIGIVIAGALFGIARGYRNDQFQRVCLGLMVVLALTAIPVYLTGEPAEKAVERLPGVSERLVERHEDAATVAFTAVEVLGGIALLGLLLLRATPDIPRGFAAVVMVVVLGVSGLFGWAGYLGGQIRHTEIRSGAAVSSAGAARSRGERATRAVAAAGPERPGPTTTDR